jgi:hypothetical protein
MAVARKPKVDAKWRNRIVEYGEMTAAELSANPKNPRVHDARQKKAMGQMLDSVGWLLPIVVNRTTGLIVDGHMRVDLTAEGPIPVAFVELSEEEEREALALMDPIGAMATIDDDALDDLAEELTDLPDALDELLAQMRGGTKAKADPKAKVEPETIDLAPLQRAHVLISVELDQWDKVSDVLDQLDDIDGVIIASMVN